MQAKFVSDVRPDIFILCGEKIIFEKPHISKVWSYITIFTEKVGYFFTSWHIILLANYSQFL